jgi:hypothetical protein
MDEVPSCRSAFDRRLMFFEYIGSQENDGTYCVHTNADGPYKHLNHKQVVFATMPHRSVLHAHAEVCLVTAQVTPTIYDYAKAAEIARWGEEVADAPSTAQLDDSD